MESKMCTKCKVEKDASEFRLVLNKLRDKAYACSCCKECDKEKSRIRSKASYHHDSGKWKARANKRRKKKRYEIALTSAKTAARRRGHSPCSASPRELKAAFTGRCAICGVLETDSGRKLCMDHNHETGKFRGWLCRQCNLASGYANDCPNRLRALATYLESNKASAIEEERSCRNLPCRSHSSHATVPF